MNKFYGSVGFVESVEVRPGVHKDVVTERKYYGDVTKRSQRWQTSEGVNDDVTISNVLSIIADPYAYQHLVYIKYVVWMGSAWKVTNIEVQHPRLILTIGGVFNGAQAKAAGGT